MHQVRPALHESPPNLKHGTRNVKPGTPIFGPTKHPKRHEIHTPWIGIRAIRVIRGKLDWTSLEHDAASSQVQPWSGSATIENCFPRITRMDANFECG
jgi:hypothetical protein